VWLLADGKVIPAGAAPSATLGDPDASPLHLLRVLVGLLLLLVPGVVAFRYLVEDAEAFAEAPGMVPALSVALLSVVGTLVLAIVRSPVTPLVGGAIVAASLAVAAAGPALGRRQRKAT
jgi:hypothetical protein